jgi:heptaprenyl diphosphate synthase
MSEQNSIVQNKRLIIKDHNDMEEYYDSLMEDLLEKIKYNIISIVDNQFTESQVGSVLDYAISSLGKMVRSRLLILCASLADDFEEKKEEVCTLAALVELVHLSSLIHDDIVDDANYRRGLLSVQAKFGKDAAVYAGDYIISKVYYFMAKNFMREEAMILVKCIEKMCRGEIGQDLSKYDEDVSLERYLSNIDGKTAALFRSSCILGGKLADLNEDEILRLSDFGTNFGVMFQLLDDMLDFTSDFEKIGKEIHKDFIEGIYTYPIIKVIENNKDNPNLKEILRKNKENSLLEEDLLKLREIVKEEKVIEETKKEIRKLHLKNIEILQEFEENPMSRHFAKSIFSSLEKKL